MKFDPNTILTIATSPQAVATIVIFATFVTLILSLVSYFRFRFKQHKKSGKADPPQFFRRIEPQQGSDQNPNRKKK
jgi:amino acid transporter